MEPCSATYQIHGRQARSAAGNDDDAGGSGVGARAPVVVSALAVPNDPLDGIMQCLGAESGFAVGADHCWATGAWLDDFRAGSMDMSTHDGVNFLEMLLDLPDTTSVLAAEGAKETATARTEAVAAVPDRPAVAMNLSPSFSSSDEDDAPWMSSTDSSSEDDDADDHWFPCESKKSGGGTKRRLQLHQQSASGGQSKQQAQTVVQVQPAPRSVEVAEEGGGGGDNRYRCHLCGTSDTPLWRSGPDGPKTLCNRCGLQYSKLRAPTTKKRLPAAKPSIGSAISNNYSIMPLAGGAAVVRKKRSVALRIG